MLYYMNCYRINDIENFIAPVLTSAVTTTKPPMQPVVQMIGPPMPTGPPMQPVVNKIGSPMPTGPPMQPTITKPTTKPTMTPVVQMTIPPKAKILGITSTINNNTITEISYAFDPSDSFTINQMPKILTKDVVNSLTNYKNYINTNNGFVLVNLNLDSMKSFTDMIITQSLKESGNWIDGKTIPATAEDISVKTGMFNLQSSQMAKLIVGAGTLSGLYTMVANNTSATNTIQLLFPNALIKNNLNFITIIRTLHDTLETSLGSLGNNSMSIPANIKDVITVVLEGFLTGLNQNTLHPEIRFANSANLLVQIGILYTLVNLSGHFSISPDFQIKTFPPIIASILSKIAASISDTQCTLDNTISFTPNICNPVQKFENIENFIAPVPTKPGHTKCVLPLGPYGSCGWLYDAQMPGHAVVLGADNSLKFNVENGSCVSHVLDVIHCNTLKKNFLPKVNWIKTQKPQKFENTENSENTDISTWMVLIIVLLLVILFLKCTA